MSGASAILTRLRDAGVTVAVADGQLKLKGPKSALGEDVLSELRAHKPALLQILARAAPLDLDAIAGRIEAWLRAMDRLPRACGIESQRLKAITLDFAFGCWAYDAVRLGWTDGQLFALDGGLIPEMARRPLHFRSIGENTIHVINGRGAYEEWPRRDMTDAAVWWLDDRVGGRDALH
jgi:hypothetical protein